MVLSWFSGQKLPGQHFWNCHATSITHYIYSLITIVIVFFSINRYGSMDGGTRRKNATRETTSTLKAWLQEHRKNPYPTKGEKIMLAIITKMTLTQVSTWFANARRRLKKENKMTWPPRNKGSEEKRYDDDEDGSQEEQIKSENNDDG